VVYEKTGIRPSYRPGFMGCFGDSIDRIDEYSVLLIELQRQIAEERKIALTGKFGTFTGAYIVLFK